MTAERSLFSRFFLALWRLVDGTRKLVLNLVFFFFLAIVVSALLQMDDTRVLQEDTTLVLRPHGDIVEQYSGTPLDHLLMQASEAGPTETRLRDLLEAVQRAAEDDRIVRMVIDPTFMRSAGLASLLELSSAVEAFKASGKPVVALADTLGQQQYLLAAMADEIWLNPKGMLWIDGFSAHRMFYREGLDKLGIEINLFRAGKYKSAGEPFVRNDMSPEAKEANLHWIGDLWYQYLDLVSRQRAMPAASIGEGIDNFADRLDAADGDFAQMALESGLVDQLISRPEANMELARLGARSEGSEGFRQVDHDNYLALTGLGLLPGSENEVAVVVAEGEILRGRQPQGTIGAMTFAEKLRELSGNTRVKAVVLRVNSPGGDAFASEKIRREVQALKEAGKRVVVSMGDVAASGGYWLAMGAEEVWASPATITGSIGVYGLLPTFQEPLERLGIHSDGVGTTEMAGKLRLDRSLDPEMQRVFQHATERTYEDFVTLVADARGMEAERVLEVAQGRVWSGTQALQHGLVDNTGTLEQAVDAAARLAGLGTDYEVVYDEWELTPFESMLLNMAGSAMARFGIGLSARSPLAEGLLGRVLADLERVARGNEGFTVAAHCLCDAP